MGRGVATIGQKTVFFQMSREIIEKVFQPVIVDIRGKRGSEEFLFDK